MRSWAWGPNPTTLVSFYKEKETSKMCVHRGRMVLRDGKTAVIHQPRKETSGETNPTGTLILDFQPPELWENDVLVFNHPVCGTLLLLLNLGPLANHTAKPIDWHQVGVKESMVFIAGAEQGEWAAHAQTLWWLSGKSF